MAKVVVGQRRSRPEPAADPAEGWRLGGLGAAGIGLIGAIDVALLWIPPDFGSVEWEFGTISATVDALPLMTLGLVGLGVAGVAQGSVLLCRSVALLGGLLAVGLLALGVLYGLSVPVAWQAVEPGMQRMLSKALAKTTGAGIVYVGLFAALAWSLWRHAGRPRGPGGRKSSPSQSTEGA